MKNLKYLILLVFSILFLVIATRTYAYYVDEAEKKAIFEVADWVIKLNGSDITLEDTHDFYIEDLKYDTYEIEPGLYNANNKFAPGMETEFVVALDVSKVEVAMDYLIEIDRSNINNDNIMFKKVESDYGELIDNLNNTYTGVLPVEKGKNVIQIKFYLEWVDSLDNNEIDTMTGSTANKKINIPVKFRFEQKV